MSRLRERIVKLYREAATSLPQDVENALEHAYEAEKGGSIGKIALSAILENIRIARDTERPLCQDTGVPIFFVRIPKGQSHLELKDTIVEATRIATKEVPLRPNAVDIISDKNSGDNTGIGFPIIYFEESHDSTFRIELMLKGSGCENVSQLYKLPFEELRAERDFDGVRRCGLDAVYKAQGRACPPYIIGIGIGASRDQVTRLAKDQLLRRIEDTNNIEVLSGLEERILKEINQLGIGPLGLGGKTTALGIKIGVNHRHPASYFVDVSICCWANRRASLTW
ncbi:MAG TPA: fumarate hydratase [Thermodesulfovibrionales bacterium]|nr:fumarate hydratase [Thermodesulfovibrionales bacterium]